MPSHTPAYYSTLKPFAALFTTGVPMLMYHKVGPRPSKVRLKGLYVSNRLFERQLVELKHAAFITPKYGLLPRRPGNPRKQISLTFDDGFENVFRHALKPLATHGFRAIEFLVASLIGRYNSWEVKEGEARERLMDAAQVRDWLAAGHEIGAHTLTHPWLTRLGYEQAREEIRSSKRKLEDMFGLPIHHFCYPYGDWNAEVRDLVIDAGYETACTTEFGVNTAASAPFELKRIMARYQSISFKSFRARLARFKLRSRAT